MRTIGIIIGVVGLAASARPAHESDPERFSSGSMQAKRWRWWIASARRAGGRRQISRRHVS